MKRFEFRLARLERLRSLERDAARAALVRARAEVEDCRRERERWRRELEEALHAELPDELATDPRAWEQLARWRERQRLRVRDAAREEARADRAARDAERLHAEAARAHRVLERLRERKYRRWREELGREEQKILDEIHLLGLGRRRRNDPDRSES